MSDFTIKKLENLLGAARIVQDQMWAAGYDAGRHDRELDIPDELEDVLRHGHAHGHAHIPTPDALLTVVLAADGSGDPRPHLEAQTWEALQRIGTELSAETSADIEPVRHQDLPPPIAAAIWLFEHDHVAIVINRKGGRPSLREALRAIHRTNALMTPVGTFLGHRITRAGHALATPTMNAAAVSMAAITTLATSPLPFGDMRHDGVEASAQRTAALTYGPTARAGRQRQLQGQSARTGSPISSLAPRTGDRVVAPDASVRITRSSASASARVPGPLRQRVRVKVTMRRRTASVDRSSPPVRRVPDPFSSRLGVDLRVGLIGVDAASSD